ncbi:hypothetical protein BLNAU_18330 [Blattamonas nauphoetae]|uniref:Uncharacterized protein n=1 Tax=Blattamonas nauphoetae TaxID=2049346 RepID=A0ABQ9X5X7_9EUKA|nr:hypothetical protein BLNAU_18330 [Blattamonas nauphoetae]
MIAFSSCLSFIEDSCTLDPFVFDVTTSLEEWQEEGAEAVQSAKRMLQALISEGFENTLEQMLKFDKDGNFDNHIVEEINYPLSPYSRAFNQATSSHPKSKNKATLHDYVGQPNAFSAWNIVCDGET